ncbi:MAG: hypothetical protein PUA51_00790 [Oscillospiraceae bacterium]|nr:hypothetical protein [Oscillospiraceae bacterium]
MDGAVLTAILIITVIAVAEGVSLFAECIFRNRRECYFAVIPVMADDDSLRERISDALEQTEADIILLNCGADSVHTEFCERFCLNHENAVFLAPDELEKYFSESFAIMNKR